MVTYGRNWGFKAPRAKPQGGTSEALDKIIQKNNHQLFKHSFHLLQAKEVNP